MKFSLVLPTLAALCIITNSYKLSIYGEMGCGGSPLGTAIEVAKPETTSACYKDFADSGASIDVTVDEGYKDIGSAVLFFEDGECDPLKIKEAGNAIVFENGCWTGKYGSFQV